MNRRAFFGAMAAAPGVLAAAAGLSVALPGEPCSFRRVSCERGDPGERAYAILCGDQKSARIFLDGVEQRFAITADMDEGSVLRHVATPEGHIAFNRVTGEIYNETVYGRVDIRIT